MTSQHDSISIMKLTSSISHKEVFAFRYIPVVDENGVIHQIDGLGQKILAYLARDSN